jgi:hypothetical protein
MVSTTLNGNIVIQSGGAATTQSAQPAPKAAATTSADAQRLSERAFRDQIREQVRAQIRGAVAQDGRGAAGDEPTPEVSVTPPAPPFERGRQFTIRGPNGELTTIGVPPAGEIIPPQAVDISIAFFLMVAVIIIGLPLARAFARRMDRKAAAPAQVPAEVSAQLNHLSQAVDAIALEVERITEGQRFTTRLLAEQRDAARQTLPSGTDR